MKIGFDYQSAAGRGGNARYTRELVRHLANLLPPKHELYLYDFVHDLRKQAQLPSGKHIHHRFAYLTPPYAPSGIQGFNDWVTHVLGRLDQLDVFHFTNPNNMISGSYNAVVTVHDLSTLTQKDFAKSESRQIFEHKLPRILNDARAIIAVSEHTKRNLVERCGADAEKITVIYEAADGRFYPEPDIQISARFGVSRFVLYAGQLQPRKNIVSLISSFAAVHKHYPTVSLVLVGRTRDEMYAREVQDAVVENHLQDAVVFAGGVDDVTLRKLYSTAECFVYPSLFEGFGLPPLEAMQCGAPVVVSNSTSLPEVVGDAGILVDPHSIESIAEAIEHVLGDSLFRENLRITALARSHMFSWEKAAHETIRLHESLCP